MLNKRIGISLIVLVITIIVIIILAGSVILSLANNNPIVQATEATFKSNISNYESELSLYISKEYANNPNGVDINTITANTDSEVRQYIKSIPDSDLSKFKIIRGKLIYIGNDTNENLWAKSVNVTPTIITDGLIMHLDASNPTSYPGNGSTWYDLSGKSNHVTLYNSPSYNSQGYFTFNGSNQYAKTTNSLDLSAYDSLTIFQNIQMTSYPSTGSFYILHELSNDYNQYTDSFVASANDPSASQNFQIAVGLKTNAGYNVDMWSKTYLNDLMWKSLAMRYDVNIPTGKEVSLFVNGESKTSLPLASLTANNTSKFGNRPLYIFSRGGVSSYVPGKLSIMLIYNRALSQAEILQNYYALKSKSGF